MSDTQRLHRVLIYVHSVTEDAMQVEVLGWSLQDEIVSVLFRDIEMPANVIVKADRYLLAKVNLGAMTKEELIFKDFEPAPEVNDEDGLG